MNPQNDFRLETVLPEGTAAAATTSSSAMIDMDDANYAIINISVSSEKNTNNAGVTLSLAESDATVYSNATTAVADVTKDNTAAGEHTYLVDQKSRKRYLFLTVTPDTTTNGDVSFSARAMKCRLKLGPASTSEMTDDTTNDSITIV